MLVIVLACFFIGIETNIGANFLVPISDFVT